MAFEKILAAKMREAVQAEREGRSYYIREDISSVTHSEEINCPSSSDLDNDQQLDNQNNCTPLRQDSNKIPSAELAKEKAIDYFPTSSDSDDDEEEQKDDEKENQEETEAERAQREALQ